MFNLVLHFLWNPLNWSPDIKERMWQPPPQKVISSKLWYPDVRAYYIIWWSGNIVLQLQWCIKCVFLYIYITIFFCYLSMHWWGKNNILNSFSHTHCPHINFSLSSPPKFPFVPNGFDEPRKERLLISPSVSALSSGYSPEKMLFEGPKPFVEPFVLLVFIDHEIIQTPPPHPPTPSLLHVH